MQKKKYEKERARKGERSTRKLSGAFKPRSFGPKGKSNQEQEKKSDQLKPKEKRETGTSAGGEQRKGGSSRSKLRSESRALLTGESCPMKKMASHSASKKKMRGSLAAPARDAKKRPCSPTRGSQFNEKSLLSTGAARSHDRSTYGWCV